MRVLKFLVILLLLILPFGEWLRFPIGNSINIKPLDITAGILAVWLLIYLFQKKQLKNALQWQLLLFPAAGLLSLVINSFWFVPNELLASALYLFRWVAYLGVLFVVLQLDVVFKRRLLQILFISGLSIVIIGYFQYFFYSDIRQLIYIGWDDHMHRLFAGFFDPNFAGAFLVLYLLFISGLLYKSISEKKKREYIVLSFVLLLTLVAILLTYSRSALVMLIVSGGVLLVFLKQKKLILALLAVLIIYIAIIAPQFHIENTNLLRTASAGARLETYNNAFTIYRDHPVLGVGFNTYRYVQQDYGFRAEKPKYPSNADSGVDNSFLFVLATTGIIGFAAFLLMWETLITNALSHFKKNILAKVFVASAFGLFINALFINSLFFPALILWMWILFGLIHSEE